MVLIMLDPTSPNFSLGGDNEDEDFSILGLIRTMKETISNLIQNIVQTIFGTIGNAVSGVTELLGIDDILGGNSDNRDGTGAKKHGIQVSLSTDVLSYSDTFGTGPKCHCRQASL